LNPLHYSVWDALQELVYQGKREPFTNVKDLQNVITDKWHDGTIRQPESKKSHVALEKASSSSSKVEWRTYSAHFLLIS